MMSQILYFYFELDVNEKLINTGLKNISKYLPVGGRIIVVAAALPTFPTFPTENIHVPNAQINFACSVYRKDSKNEIWNKNTHKNTAYQRLLKCPRILIFKNDVESKRPKNIDFIRVNYKTKMEKTLRQIQLAREKIYSSTNYFEKENLQKFITKKMKDLAEQQIIMDGPEELLFNIVETANYKEEQINSIRDEILHKIHPFPGVYDVKGPRLFCCKSKNDSYNHNHNDSVNDSESRSEYEENIVIERTPIFLDYQ